MKPFGLMVPTTLENWQGFLEAPYMSSMSHTNGIDINDGIFAWKYEKSSIDENVGGVGSKSHPMHSKSFGKPVFKIKIPTHVPDETLTLIWVSLKTLNL